jgi:hypothetical protein
MSNEMKNCQEDGNDDLRLPDELAACEAQLASEPLAAPRISRDEVLYRAGWAACIAAPAAVAHVRPVIGYRGQTVAMSSACSAALAASLAVAVTLGLAPRSSEPQLEKALPHIVDASPSAVEAPHAASLDAWLAAVQSLAAARRLASGESLTIGGDLRSGRWDQAVSADDWADASELAPAVTTRALLEEMLPRAGSAEDETRGGSNGVLDLLRPLAWGGETI